MHRLERDHVHYRFDAAIPPALEIAAGDEVLLETWDSRRGAIRTEADLFPVEPPELDRVNPATGPILVKGAEPGDTLAVRIQHIALGPQGQVPVSPYMGVVREGISRTRFTLCRVEGEEIVFGRTGIRFSARPMVGVIGVAPAGAGICTIHMGPHGGNMDHNDVAPGTVVYLPVFVPGGLLSVGDVHASMGDGETTGGGIDIPAEVTIGVSVLKGCTISRPVLELGDHVVTTANAREFFAAAEIAVGEMALLLQRKLGVDWEEALQLVSARGDLLCGQTARGPFELTLRCKFPRLWEGRLFDGA